MAKAKEAVGAAQVSPWLTAAILMENPYCSCKLTRVRHNATVGDDDGGREVCADCFAAEGAVTPGHASRGGGRRRRCHSGHTRCTILLTRRHSCQPIELPPPSDSTPWR